VGYEMILITKIAQPEVGAVMAQYCEVCKTTTFMVHELAKRPDDGDYWLLTMPCSTHPWKFTCELDKVQLSAVPRYPLYVRAQDAII
jgi:hypothetical protein